MVVMSCGFNLINILCLVVVNDQFKRVHQMLNPLLKLPPYLLVSELLLLLNVFQHNPLLVHQLHVIVGGIGMCRN